MPVPVALRSRRKLTTRGWAQERNHGWNVEGDQGLGPNIGALAPRARPEAGLGGECGRGSPPPAVGKIFENSDAKSCIHVASVLISGLPRTKSSGDQYIVGLPNLEDGGPVSPLLTVVAPMDERIKR